MKTTFKLKAISAGLLIGLAGSTPAGAVSIADTPLFIGAAVDPNVMLLVDTSGSMDNIIWASGYDNTLTYPDWSNGGANYQVGIEYDFEHNRLFSLFGSHLLNRFIY